MPLLLRTSAQDAALRELKLSIPLTDELATIVRKMSHVPVLEYVAQKTGCVLRPK